MFSNYLVENINHRPQTQNCIKNGGGGMNEWMLNEEERNNGILYKNISVYLSTGEKNWYKKQRKLSVNVICCFAIIIYDD